MSEHFAILKLFLFLALTVFLTGCSVLVKSTIPTPGHTELVQIDPSIRNAELVERLLIVFKKSKVAPCDGVQHDRFREDGCFTSLWQGHITKSEYTEGSIEIGDYPNYSNNRIGHSARIWRISPDKIGVTVKGVGPYYMKIPNKDVAQKLAGIIRQSFEQN